MRKTWQSSLAVFITLLPRTGSCSFSLWQPLSLSFIASLKFTFQHQSLLLTSAPHCLLDKVKTPSWHWRLPHHMVSAGFSGQMNSNRPAFQYQPHHPPACWAGICFFTSLGLSLSVEWGNIYPTGYGLDHRNPQMLRHLPQERFDA